MLKHSINNWQGRGEIIFEVLFHPVIPVDISIKPLKVKSWLPNCLFLKKLLTKPQNQSPRQLYLFCSGLRGTPKNKLPNFVGWASCPSLMISGQDARTTRNFWVFF
jgi:hypothetical protein